MCDVRTEVLWETELGHGEINHSLLGETGKLCEGGGFGGVQQVEIEVMWLGLLGYLVVVVAASLSVPWSSAFLWKNQLPHLA